MSYTLMIGVGAQKAGTTWLHQYLLRHPQCAMSRIKEMHFWNEMFLPEDAALARRYYSTWLGKITTRIKEGYVPSPRSVTVGKDLLERAAMVGAPESYRLFFDRRVGKAKVTGEITPAYTRLGREAFRQMRDCHPDVRPVLIMRDPVDRFWAGMRDLARSENRPADSALIAERLTRAPHLERGAYHRTVADLDAVFGPKGVLVLYFEDLFTEAAIARLCAFLGIDPVPADFDTRINQGPDARDLAPADAAAIYAAHRDTYSWAATREAPLPARWAARMDAFEHN